MLRQHCCHGGSGGYATCIARRVVLGAASVALVKQHGSSVLRKVERCAAFAQLETLGDLTETKVCSQGQPMAPRGSAIFRSTEHMVSGASPVAISAVADTPG